MLRAEFERLADQWERETVFMSYTVVDHPAYKEIVAAGAAVIPFLLERVQAGRGHWFVALHEITGENPVDKKDYGKVRIIEAAWVKWGRDKGYI